MGFYYRHPRGPYTHPEKCLRLRPRPTPSPRSPPQRRLRAPRDPLRKERLKPRSKRLMEVPTVQKLRPTEMPKKNTTGRRKTRVMRRKTSTRRISMKRMKGTHNHRHLLFNINAKHYHRLNSSSSRQNHLISIIIFPRRHIHIGQSSRLLHTPSTSLLTYLLQDSQQQSPPSLPRVSEQLT